MSEKDKTIWRQEVLGNCKHCRKQNVYALWTVYNNRLADGSFEQLIRCLSCRTPNEFEVTEPDWWKLAQKFRPFRTDKDDVPYNPNSSGRYTKGIR
jgi:hypothetical protein